MKRQFTPKQLADATGVSESSVKRWCDRGLIDTVRTAGGHRRIPLDAAIRFVKDNHHELADPTILGLPAGVQRNQISLADATTLLREVIEAGDEARCRQLFFDLYFSEHRLSRICDEVVAEVFHQIGDRWECKEVEVFQERRGCEITVRLLHELSLIVPQRGDVAPLAIGGTLSGDQYALPTTMVEMVLRDSGWHAHSLGTSLPTETLQAAMAQQRPQLFWLSVSHFEDQERLVADLRELYETKPEGTAFVIGGRALSPEIRSRIQFSAYCENLQRLEDLAAAIFAVAQQG